MSSNYPMSTRALTLVLSGIIALIGLNPIAQAGPGLAPGYSAHAAPPPAPPDIVVPTYYASSPLGLRPDLVGGANSPQWDTGTAIRKFVDILPSIPGLAPTTNAGTGFIGGAPKYVPLAVPGIWWADGADYYHLAVVEYTEQMHSDLPKATTLRGYVQIEEPGLATAPAGSKHVPLFYPDGVTPLQLPDANGVNQQVYGFDKPHYLGPTIVATKDRPIRIKYSNLLPPGAATTVGGVVSRNGDLPIPVDATLAGGALQQNRAEIHLHGGLTPWISDGTPHQWTIPVGDTRYGFVSDLAITTVGTGYTAPVVTIDPPQSFATASATVSAGLVTALNVVKAGANYLAASPPIVTINAPPPVVNQSARATASLGNGPASGTVSRLTLTSGGSAYPSVPTVTISAPPATAPASGTATTRAVGTGLGVASIAVTAPGVGYLQAPVVTIAAPPATTPATAAATVAAASGAITAIAVNPANFGYWSAPTVTVAQPPNAVNATGTATTTASGGISAITVNAGNFGYWTVPTVTVAAPPAAVAATGTSNVSNQTHSVTSISVNNSNFGYFTAPTVTIAAPAPSVQGTATATLTGGRVTSITTVAGGYGYWAAPTVTVSGGTPTTAAVITASVNNGAITGFNITNGGAGYASAPTLTISAPTASVTATATATIAAGKVTGFTISGGANYRQAPTVTIGAPAPSATATATATIANGAITAIAVAGGANYASAPQITISNARNGAAANATATVANGVITSISVGANSGYNPLTLPAVTISPPTPGVQATASASIGGATGAVTRFNVNNQGSGYLATPLVTVAAPPAPVTATATATLTAGRVTALTLTNNGSGYFTTPTVTIMTSTAMVQATATANVGASGAIGGFTVTNHGTGYVTAPTVTVAPPPGAVQATATATATAGALTGIAITNAGGGYLAVPNVTVSGGSGAIVNALIAAPVGAGFRQVPDMVGTDLVANRPLGYTPPMVGEGTLYYTNNQTQRLMFYHDHTSGTTRLNVYMGEAAPYLIVDPLVDPVLPIPNTKVAAAAGAASLQGYVPEEQIPLVIQDKTFVPKDIAQQDAFWDGTHWGQYGDLWFPHVYETNQNPAMLRSASNTGRWDWGPWFAIIYPSQYALPSGKYGDVTTTPEAFMDTMVVNGTAFPTLTVEPRAYRLRILNASNDRFLNLGLYKADPAQTRAGDGARYTEVLAGPNLGAQPQATPGNAFSANPANATYLPWPSDGRWAPLPTEMGPPMYQIGNEAGLLPHWVEVDSIPVNYDYNRRSVTVLNMSQNNDPTQVCYPECHGLYLGAAERADVVVDFAKYAGQWLILYNDAPSPNPGYDPRIDYFTGNDPTNTANYANGGAPNTQAGYAPNTRTVMQIYVSPTQNTAANPIDYVNAAVLNPVSGLWEYNPNALGAGRVVGQTTGTPGIVQTAYAATQAPPIVGESAYNVAFPQGYTDQYGDMFLGSQNEPVFFVTNPGPLTLTGIAVTGQTTSTAGGVGTGTGTGTNPNAGSGTGYATAPAVLISAPTNCVPPGTQTLPCAPATATATVAGGQVTAITMTNPGAGYTSVPAVTIIAGGAVAAVSLTDVGSGYTTAPTVTLTGGGGTGATAVANFNATTGALTSVSLTSPGSGYTTAPAVAITPPTTVAAAATATVVGGGVSSVQLTAAGGGSYTAGTIPTVTLSAPLATVQGTQAVVSAQTLMGYCCVYTVVNGGSGYVTPPTVTAIDPAGVGAVNSVSVTGGVVIAVNPTVMGTGYSANSTLATTVTAPPPAIAGITAQATATMDVTGTMVTGFTVANPGSGYTTAPTVTVSGGLPARAVAAVAGGGTGATAQAIASTTHAFVVPAAIPGSGVPAAANSVPLTLPPGLASMLGCNAAQTSCPNAGNVVLGRLMNPAIQELFEPFYGRMNATLGIEMPLQSLSVQTTLPLNYVDPATEIMEPGTVQMWKITHNGVDAHPVHFHLVNVQVLNRVGWDGTIKAPEDNEIGWKETLKMNPLEDVIVAMRTAMPQVPFGLDRSIRPQDPSQPLGVNLGFTQFAVRGINGNVPNGLPVPVGALGIGQPEVVVNSLEDYDNEYVWHCHILGHEENDFMRALVATSQPLAPDAPTAFAVTQAGAGLPVVATWVDPTPIGPVASNAATFGNAKNEIGFRLERATSANGPWLPVATTPANATTASDALLSPVVAGTTVYYRVYGYNAPTLLAVNGGTSSGIGAPAVTSIVVR